MPDSEAKIPPIGGLRVATNIHFVRSAFNKLNSMVFLYDPHFVPTTAPEEIGTLPFASFFVVKEEVIQSNQVSKRRVILYEPEADKKEGEQFQNSVVHVIADNITVDPLEYHLECIVPADALTALVGNNVRTYNTVAEVLGAMTEFMPGVILSALSLLRAGLGMLTPLRKLVSLVSSTTFSDPNRRTLLAMARRRNILRYKAWDSWNTKNVVITGINISKVGTEDDYFRANIKLQEMPILFVGPFPSADKAQPLSRIRASATVSISKFFNEITSGSDRRIL